MTRRALPPVLLAMCASCATLDPDVSIPERKLPTSFADDATAPSAATTKWRDFFADEALNGVITLALTNNQDLRIALQRIEIARAGVHAATGALLPQVGIGLGAGIRKFGLYTMDGAGNATTDITPGRTVPTHLPDFAIGLVSSWEIDLWGKLRNQRESAAARYLASIEGSHLVITALIADVASTYFELLALDNLGEVLGRAATRQQEAVEVVRLQKQAGRANELAVQQFEAQLAETRALAQEVEQQTVEAEGRLNLLLGRYPQPVARRKALLFAEVSRNLSAGLPSELLRNRPDIREAELQVHASKCDVRAARAAFLPNLDITAGLGFQAFNPSFLFRVPESVGYSLLGGLVAPLVNRKGLEAQFSGAKANQIQAMYNYQRVVLVAFTEVVNALANIRNTEEILALKKAQKAAMERTVETADILYRAGKASYLEVLVAQQNALRAELDLIDVWRRRRVADVAVYRALGGGWFSK